MLTRFKKKKKEEAGTVLSPLYHRALTGWESHPDIFPLALKLVRHVSSLRCCFSFPATDTVARSQQGGCMCAHKRTVTWWHSLVSFFTFLRCFASRRKNEARSQRGQRTSGRSGGEATVAGRLLRCRYGRAILWSRLHLWDSCKDGSQASRQAYMLQLPW